MPTIAIAAHFRGPSTSGNGGYTAGLVAGFVDGDAEVTLRRPPPLDRPLRVETDGETARVFDDDILVAEAIATTVDLDLPPSPGVEAATTAATGYAGLDQHFFPECYSCGPDRPDGLRIFPGPVGTEMVAAPFDASGLDDPLPDAIVWAALDCAGAWAEHRADPVPVVLGRMAAHIPGPVPASGRYVVAGWPLGGEGRKRFSGTALYDEHGTALAWSRQTWIRLEGGAEPPS